MLRMCPSLCGASQSVPRERRYPGRASQVEGVQRAWPPPLWNPPGQQGLNPVLTALLPQLRVRVWGWGVAKARVISASVLPHLDETDSLNLMSSLSLYYAAALTCGYKPYGRWDNEFWATETLDASHLYLLACPSSPPMSVDAAQPSPCELTC